ncbi:hypothetical protein J1614_000318 [Plenodomus biglobosus]|nr:hypothetical protein J1614_000318 [Plenodomus biglobosus]
MGWFIIFVVILAMTWATIGVLLARWLKQAGHTKPFKGRELSSHDLYGGGSGYGREDHRFSQAYSGDSQGYVGGRQNMRPVGLGQFGKSGVKGL